MKTYTIIWRLDGEFQFTDIDLSGDESSLEILHKVIEDTEFDPETIQDQKNYAEDWGYELIAAFHAPQIEYLMQ